MSDARRYLEQVSKLDKLIANKIKEIEQWRSIAEGTSTGSNGDRVQASVSLYKMEDAVIHIVEMEEQANKMIDRCTYMKQDAISLIEMIEDATMYDLMHKRYIEGIPLTEVADMCGLSWDSTKRKHKKALRIVQEIMNEREKGIDGIRE